MSLTNLRANAAIIAAALSNHGIKRVAVAYAGDGDEGGIDAFQFFNDADEVIDEAAVPSIEVTLTGQSTPTPINDALVDVLNDCHSAVDLDNYEDGEGGLGELHIDADGGFRLEHKVRVTTYETHTHYFA